MRSSDLATFSHSLLLFLSKVYCRVALNTLFEICNNDIKYFISRLEILETKQVISPQTISHFFHLNVICPNIS